MVIAKYEQLKLGIGNYTDNTHSTIYSSNILPTVSDGKDGDVWIKTPANWTSGQDVEIFVKINGSWRGLAGSPIEIILLRNIAVPTTFLSISSTLFTKIEISYLLHFVNNNLNIKSGIYTILLNSSGFQYNHEFSEMGIDLETNITLEYNNGKVEFKYTTSQLPLNRIFKYSIRGWK